MLLLPTLYLALILLSFATAYWVCEHCVHTVQYVSAGHNMKSFGLLFRALIEKL